MVETIEKKVFSEPSKKNIEVPNNHNFSEEEAVNKPIKIKNYDYVVQPHVIVDRICAAYFKKNI